MHRWIAVAAVTLSLAGTARAAIKEEPVTYKDGETTMKALSSMTTRRRASSPASCWCEWWGINQSTCQ